ncbi:tyrosine-type recombinase/integrase [Enterocloster citroniae]|uniref:tyrosine-type recombinase/integrase n=1 Tax=Enterocloster citroniae TaxID=358743 RepID=UPI001D07F157|nr:tyrosine-type recombinase/integrase [Enterocloster citroniae]MCB7064133.1 tyrosine-type recombinase/integrase [Enterocloster citroniae]
MNNTENQSVKAQIINNVIVSMTYYLNPDVLEMLERVLTKNLVDVVIERINTLPMEMKDSIDNQNGYILQLFLYKKKKLQDGTKYGYVSAIKRLVTLVYKPLTDMEESDIYYYLDWYEYRNVPINGRKNQPKTINNERRFLSAFFTWMRKEKLIGSNPVEAIEPLKVAKKPIDYFTQEEMASLKDGCESLRERAVIEVLRSTGARVGEVVGITIDLINWETGDVMILGEKGNRYRTLYLDPDAIHHFRKYLNSRTDNNPAIFVSSRRPYQALSTCAIRGIVKDVAKRAGITSRAYPHKMRKTLGMELKNKGVDIGTIQEIMGHADSKVTSLYYAQSTPDTLRIIRNKAA